MRPAHPAAPLILLVGATLVVLNTPAYGQCIDYEDYLHVTAIIDTPGRASGIAVSGNHAYVADNSGLLVIDITNPQSPQIVGNASGRTEGVAVAGTYAYVTEHLPGGT